jgi:SOS-response transcriptional repressor LexA
MSTHNLTMHQGKRIKLARQRAKLTQKQLANAINQQGGKSITRSSFSTWEAHPNIQISADHIFRLAKILNVSAEWLLFGQEPMERLPENIYELLPAFGNAWAIPLLDEGQLKHSIRNKAPTAYLCVDKELTEVASKTVFAMRVKCTSMSPMLEPGDTVIIEPEAKPHPGEIVLAKLANPEAIVLLKYRPCQYDPRNYEAFELIPLNENWPKISVNKENPAKLLGTLIEYHCRTRQSPRSMQGFTE